MNGKPAEVRDSAKAPYRIASRLNSFRQPSAGIEEAIRRMAAVPSLTALELNYPQHFIDLEVSRLEDLLAQTGLPLTALNLRFEDRRFVNGAFTAPDRQVREAALAIARQAVEIAARMGAGHVVLWMAQDGWDYPFQVDYARLWHDEIEAFRAVAEEDPAIRVSVEYKPFEPRRFSVIASMSDALLAAREVGLPNFGITLDVCHSYMAGEHPAASAALALRERKLFGVHLNDGRGRGDDGLAVASVHPPDAIELMHVLRIGRYEGTLYFDTFPLREDPAAELAANIARVEWLLSVVDQIDAAHVAAIQDQHDGLAASLIGQRQ